MRHVRHEVVPDGLADRVRRRVRFDVRGHVERAHGEGDDGGVALGDELVPREALDVEEEERRQRVQQAVALAHAEVLLRLHPVVLGQDGGQRHLRDDVTVQLVLEQGRRGQVERQHEVARRVRDDLGGFLEAQPVARVGFGGDALRFHLEFALEDAVDDARAGFRLAAAEGEVHVVEEPAEEVDGVGLVEEVESLVGLARDLLDELVGGDVGFEGARVPDLADEDGEAGGELGGGGGGEVFEHEEIAERWGVGEGLDDDVEIVVFFDVIHAHEAGAVLLAGEIPGVFGYLVEHEDFLLG